MRLAHINAAEIALQSQREYTDLRHNHLPHPAMARPDNFNCMPHALAAELASANTST